MMKRRLSDRVKILCTRTVFGAAALSAVLFARQSGGSAPGPNRAFAGEPSIAENLTIEQGYALFQENRDNPDFVILDVRTDAEFRAGRLPNALNYDVNSGAFGADIGVLDRSKTYFVYCRTGSRSARAVGIMKALGFTKLFNLNGGYVQWEKRGYPVVR